MTKKFRCLVCGHIHEGETAPQECLLCFVGPENFHEIEETEGDLTRADEHGLGSAKNVDPEIAEAFKRYAFEEAEHAAKFAELLGDCVWDTKTNVQKRILAEQGACEDKLRIAKLAKQHNLDAIHDTVHEMCKDEARQGAGFQGLYNRFFK